MMSGLKTMTQNNGIEVRGDKIRIHFSYKGERCRETLSLPANKANIKQATLIRAEILLKIQRDEFNYREYFPTSKNADKFSVHIPNNKKYKCEELLLKLQDNYAQTVANGHMSPSTYDGYSRYIRCILIPYFGRFYIHQVTPPVIKSWIETIGATAKTIQNALIILRAMFADALNDELIESDPLKKLGIDRLLRINAVKSDYVVKPFSADEKLAIINAALGQLRNLIQFGFWSGLRISELIALQWDVVDFTTGIITIKRAKVVGIVKEKTKTQAGKRELILLPKAREALLAQIEFTAKQEYIFHNPNTNEAWSSSKKFAEAWRRVLAISGVEYRNPYQMRHTYASTLLSNGENPLLVAQQMGHVDVSMIFSVYGKWIPNTENPTGFKNVY